MIFKNSSESIFAVVSSSFGLDECGNYTAFLTGYPSKVFLQRVLSKALGDDVSLFPFSNGFQLPYEAWHQREVALIDFKVICGEVDSFVTMEISLLFKQPKPSELEDGN